MNSSEWIDLENISLNEDLGVWFGTKKKPKGSNQPKGPWVNICSKDKDGKHPPCGRHEASSKSYPKCRAAGVAGKMSDDEKKAACRQKRNAEKKDTQTGKGQKPVMVSYKPKNESVMKKTIKLTESDLIRIVKKVIKEQVKNNFDYKMPRKDSWNSKTTGKALYFVKNGDTYDVWYENQTGDIVSGGVKLPKRDELGIVYNKENNEVLPNDTVKTARAIARTITTDQGMGNSIAEKLPSLIVFTDDDGLPKKGMFGSAFYHLDVLKDGNEVKLEDGNEALGNDYFVVEKPNRKEKYGRGVTSGIHIEDIAEKA